MSFLRRVLMCVGPIVLASLDASLTVHGQLPEYWAGSFQIVQEHNPLAHAVLAWHPMAFAAGMMLWIAAFGAAILWLRVSWARAAALLVMFGHALGSMSWLLRWPYGLLYSIGLLVVVRLLAIPMVDLGQKTPTSTAAGDS